MEPLYNSARLRGDGRARRACGLSVFNTALMLALAGAAAGAAEAQSTGPQDHVERCNALVRTAIAARQIGLPTTGAVVAEARLVAAPAKPAYCLVKGQIKPVDPAAPPIQFQVNLPAAWNNKVVQYGGGGLNGFLVSGLDPLRDAPPGPTPLEQGYVTAGTDAGHPMTKEVQQFALNDEALANHAYAAYKKTHDVALELVKRFYDRSPKRFYFYGGSEGGREGLIGAQRFPKDYDGIVSTVPVLSWTGVNLYGYQVMLDHQAGGYMTPAHVKLWQDAEARACDANDGIVDGIIANYRRCDATAELSNLRCADGKEAGTGCFSDAQLTLINRTRVPYQYGVTLTRGETSIPPFGLGGQSYPGNVIPIIVDAPGQRTDPLGRPRYASGDIRYFVFRDGDKGGPIDMARYGERVRQVSALMDMNDPDLSRFAARGGKLIMKSNTADYLVTPGSIWRYYDSVVQRMGKNKADGVVRLYVSPGTGHGGTGVAADGSPIPDRVDLLDALDRWVETGRPMENPVLTAYDKSGQTVGSLPFCRYPDYPRYLGSGDRKQASSYRCVPTTQ